MGNPICLLLSERGILRRTVSEVTRGHWYQGLVYRAEEKWEEAVASISLSIKEDPFAAKYYLNRGICYQMSGQMEKALEDFSRALSHDPGYG